MASSYFRALKCARCSTSHDPDQPQHLCTACSSPLLAEYDLGAVAEAVRREDLAAREHSFWRYTELLPLKHPSSRVSLGESFTPLLSVPSLASNLGLPNLLVKDEGLLPTGSFKARGAAIGVSRARELGAEVLALPTAGNAGGAWAAYGARAGLQVRVVTPIDAPVINRAEVRATGAMAAAVHGLISDAGAIVARAVARHGWYDAGTLREPYRIEGKKTMGLELADQLGWELPDAIIYPCGGGVGVIGMWKAFAELTALGWVSGKLPKMIVVQAAGCAPIVRAFDAGEAQSRIWQGAATVASGLRVPKALGDFLVLRALYESGGTAVAVDDAAIIETIYTVGRREGLLLSPEGAATIAAIPALLASGALAPGDRTVAFNTGAGIKYPEALSAELPELHPGDDLDA
ncbi:MAG: threonine synthase [Chloroflexi bacterium]|nr:threonine synthase [Chloroflexota bacterium]